MASKNAVSTTNCEGVRSVFFACEYCGGMASNGEGRSAAETAAGVVLSGALEVMSAGYVGKETSGGGSPKSDETRDHPAATEENDQEMAEAAAPASGGEASAGGSGEDNTTEPMEQSNNGEEEDIGGDVLMMALGKRHVEPPRIQGPRDRHCWNAENEGAVLALYKAGLRPKAIKQRLQWNIPTVVVHNKITSLKRNGTITEREFPSHRRFSTRASNSSSSSSDDSATVETATPPLSSTISGGISKSYGALPQRRSRRAVKPVQIYSPQIPTGTAVASGSAQPQSLFPPQIATSAPQSKSRSSSSASAASVLAAGSLESMGSSVSTRALNRSSSFESSLARQALVNQTRREREGTVSSDESDDDDYYSEHNPDKVARALELGMVELKHALLEQQKQQWLHLCDLTHQSLAALATQHKEQVQRTQEAIATTINAHCKALQQKMDHTAEVNARRLDVLESRIGTALSMITEFVRSNDGSEAGPAAAADTDEAMESSSQGSNSGFSLHSGSSVDQRLDFLCRLNTSSNSVAAVPVTQD